MKQRTISREVSIKGVSLHTGKVTKMTLLPKSAETVKLPKKGISAASI